MNGTNMRKQNTSRTGLMTVGTGKKNGKQSFLYLKDIIME